MSFLLNKTGSRLALASVAARGVAVVLAASALSGCYYTSRPPGLQVADAAPPNDYRQRHPIAIKESDRKVVLFIGAHRGSLTPAQRADVVSFARAWQKEATGGVIMEVPSGTANQRAARDASGEVRALLAAAEVPSNVITTTSYQPIDRERLGPIKLHYPRIAAEAGPCGLWPRDLGPSYDPEYLQNRPYWNLGCASQRNLAAMIDNPADLVQPRGEAPPYTARRSIVLDKYRKGEATVTTYANPNQGKIATFGQ